ncbi:hypothetical protein Agub_g7575, partial [Astrephomene gubernaculifera]
MAYSRRLMLWGLATTALLVAFAASPASAACTDGCPNSYSPVCMNGRMWNNTCLLKCEFPNAIFYGKCPSPPPSPAPPDAPIARLARPFCNPYTTRYNTLTYYNSLDCKTYTLFDVDAVCPPTWLVASDYCDAFGLELAPWDNDASNAALQALCTANRYTCWADGRSPGGGLCPLVSQEGATLFQTCQQGVRFVCRTR